MRSTIFLLLMVIYGYYSAGAMENALFVPDAESAKDGIWEAALEKPGRLNAAVFQVPVERIAGKNVVLAAEIEQQDISEKPKHYNGVKLMLVLTYADGSVGYLQAENSPGALPWTPHAVAVTVPADIRDARVYLALEEVSGTARFRDVRIVENVPVDYAGYLLTGAMGKERAEYAAGEEMVFGFSLRRNGEPAGGLARITLAGDDGVSQVLYRDFGEDGELTLRRALDRPGFVMAKATLLTPVGLPAQSKGRNIQYGLGAGVAMETLRQGAPEPEDFDAYWRGQKEKLAAVPVRELERKLFKETGTSLVYEVKIACAGRRPVSGLLAIPKNAKAATLPLRMVYEGYGISSSRVEESADAVVFVVNAHGIDNGRDAAYYAELARGELKNYGLRDNENQRPETSYFTDMILRDLRALDYARTLPEWDGKTIRLSGGSQGAMQAAAVAALSEGITECALRVPWLCDVDGVGLGRARSTFRPNPAPGLRYFDTVNFAKRARAPVKIVAGLTDWVCPPSGVMVLYHNWKGPAELTLLQGLDHGGYPGYDERTTPRMTFPK